MNKFNFFVQLIITSLLFMVLITSQPKAQSIIAWTEENSTLGLGYPVPIPVDTPEPFDGFRTYAGLFAKHQMMAMNNPYITGHIVGQTHYNRDIWAYVLSDDDNITKFGTKEGAMLVNGGIHAREWQTPETLTQIITDFNDHSNDESFYQYLLENTSIITIPTNNIDGFLQTQRFPTENWLGTDITVPAFWPRDGRMRRKNMLDTDEVLTTEDDHLNGVDLNRNNNPYWATSTGSSSDVRELRYHGTNPESEPETQARLAAVELVDEDQLRAYTDVHSYSQVYFSVVTFNQNRNFLQTLLLDDFTSHHQAFPSAKNYVDFPNEVGFGIGSTDEYFAYTYEIPSWTLEIEPTNRGFLPDPHPDLPGFGADYGGFGNNGSDGFILPDSEIKRVREQLSESFMVIWYGQAGPPSITQFRIIDQQSNAVVYDAEWDITETGNRELYSHYFDQVLAGRDYSMLIRFDKPMRYRNDAGEVTNLPGQLNAIFPVIEGFTADNSIELNLNNRRWINQKDNGWESYGWYKDDTFVVDFNVDSTNDTELTLSVNTSDMIGQMLDSNPETVVTWSGGQWINYENNTGAPSLRGGKDSTLKVNISNEALSDRRMQQPQTALYFDPARNGEGFNLETLADERVLLQWYTFDEQGNDQWMLNTQTLAAENMVFMPELLVAEGGVFGPEFDANNITFSEKGAVEMIFEAANRISVTADEFYWVQQGKMKYTAPNGQKFRTNLEPITLPKGVRSPSDAGIFDTINGLSAASIAGSWFDPSRNGEGFHIQETINGNAVILWYSFGLDGEQKWFIGSEGLVTESDDLINITFAEVSEVTQGTSFGITFDADEFELAPWGSIEINLQCTSGTFSFESSNAEYGSGTYSVVPITRPIINEYACE